MRVGPLCRHCNPLFTKGHAAMCESRALQRELSEAGIHIPIIFITSHGDIPMTVQAMKAGAVEFLTGRI